MKINKQDTLWDWTGCMFKKKHYGKLENFLQ